MLSRSENSIVDVNDLELRLSEPDESTLRSLASLPGDILVLGAGGKMGPTLARMAKRASDAAGISRRVIAASRFSSLRLPEKLQSWGIETISCDLLDRAALARLPDAPNIVYMAGMKFGSTGQESLTWAMNCISSRPRRRSFSQQPNRRILHWQCLRPYACHTRRFQGKR